VAADCGLHHRRLRRRRERLTEAQLRGVGLGEPALGLSPEELLLEPAQLALGLVEARLRREHAIDQLLAAYVLERIACHVLSLLNRVSDAKRNPVEQEAQRLLRELLALVR
jgi:hypothetical protein